MPPRKTRAKAKAKASPKASKKKAAEAKEEEVRVREPALKECGIDVNVKEQLKWWWRDKREKSTL